jgi:hypothetical protein
MIKIRIKEVKDQLAQARHHRRRREIARLESSLKDWKRHLHDAEMIEFEERVGFKSMERNAGVWDER